MTANSTQADDLLDGAIDAHVHGAPDVFERRMNVVELARDGAVHGMDGLLLLNHFSDTTPQAAIVETLVDDITVKGGLKLNRPAGGLNPEAVRIALELGAAKIDMPTQQAANELRAKGDDPKQGISITASDELRPALHNILGLVGDTDATVATGHLSSREIRAVTTAAFDHGIQQPVVSHPTLPSIDLPVDVQVHLAEQGAMIEYCYVTTTDVLSSHFEGWEPHAPADLLEQANEVGPGSVILATDFGQPSNPVPADGLRKFIEAALEYGFSEHEVEQMVQENPREVYGFE